MAYITTADVKSYLGLTGAVDDTLLGYLIDRAQKAIETHTQRIFSASADTTRLYTVGEDTDGRYLYLDEDLCAITTVTTDADATSPTTLTDETDYITIPRNTTPYIALQIIGSSTYEWTYTDDPAMGVSVIGRFAYSTTPPEDILHACIRLVGYYYRQKDSQVFDVTAIPEAGVISIPQGIPADVKRILEPYRRRTY